MMRRSVNTTYTTGHDGIEGRAGWMVVRRVHNHPQSRTMIVATERAVVEALLSRLLQPMQRDVLPSVELIARSIQALAAFVERNDAFPVRLFPFGLKESFVRL